MSRSKYQVRADFRRDVFRRDENRCRGCGSTERVDAHHITDRGLMPGGGYVVENGITLCQEKCHPMAERYHATGVSVPGFSPEELYDRIGSSLEAAVSASKARQQVEHGP